MPFIVDHDKAKHYIEVLREQSWVVKNDNTTTVSSSPVSRPTLGTSDAWWWVVLQSGRDSGQEGTKGTMIT